MYQRFSTRPVMRLGRRAVTRIALAIGIAAGIAAVIFVSQTATAQASRVVPVAIFAAIEDDFDLSDLKPPEASTGEEGAVDLAKAQVEFVKPTVVEESNAPSPLDRLIPSLTLFVLSIALGRATAASSGEKSCWAVIATTIALSAAVLPAALLAGGVLRKSNPDMGAGGLAFAACLAASIPLAGGIALTARLVASRAKGGV